MIDTDQMHGVWVTRFTYPGSYGRISYRDQDGFWIRWSDPGYRTKVVEPASLEPFDNLKMLPVQPEPWFAKCLNCGMHALPLGAMKKALELLRDPTI